MTATSARDLYVGLMTGTSLDGVDAVLADFTHFADGRVDVRGQVHRPFDAALAAELLALNDPHGDDELHRSALAGNALSRLYAVAVDELLATTGTGAADVVAIGAHGQTVRHRPGEFDGTGYTVQLGNPSLLAELTGIDVVADLRSRDLAAGGQGAPLVPAFHRAVFGRRGRPTAVLNLGGIANLTVLGAAPDAVLGFDCGPANVLMDHWCRLQTGAAFDDRGRWAASGQVVPPLLATMRADAYFAAAPPKSTGRDRFNAGWLTTALAAGGGGAAADVQATLAELTAMTCAADVRAFAGDADLLLVCGGGALNDHLMGRLRALLPDVDVETTDVRGMPPAQVEATAFAWLARAFCRREPGNRTTVTGARGERVLGSLSPGRW